MPEIRLFLKKYLYMRDEWGLHGAKYRATLHFHRLWDASILVSVCNTSSHRAFNIDLLDRLSINFWRPDWCSRSSWLALFIFNDRQPPYSSKVGLMPRDGIDVLSAWDGMACLSHSTLILNRDWRCPTKKQTGCDGNYAKPWKVKFSKLFNSLAGLWKCDAQHQLPFMD